MTALAAGTFSIGLLVGNLTGASAALLGSGIFPDVERGAFYDDAVGAMYDAGVITGYQDGRFGPNDPVTRGQVAVMMQRFLNLVEGGSATTSSSRNRSSSSSSNQSSAVPGAGQLGFSTTGFDIGEGTSNASINVTRTGGSEGTVRVSYTTEDGSAVAGSDYVATSGQLTFEDGETSKTISVTITNDQIGEAADTFTVSLSDPTGGASLGANTEVEVRILDNDGGSGASSSSAGTTSSLPTAGGFRFGGNTYNVAENASQFTVVVERIGGSSGEVSVQYETVELTGGVPPPAEAGDNYSATSGTLTFNAGSTEQSFTISIHDNSEATGNKRFQVRLKNPTGGAVLASSTSDVVIVDDEVGVTFGTGSLKFADDEYSLEEGESATVTILRQFGTKSQVTVKLTSQNGNANSSDYQTIDTTLTFRDGEASKAVTITAKTDNESDDNETFSLWISNPTGGVQITTPDSTTVTIDD
jgi:hypothetical protein